MINVATKSEKKAQQQAREDYAKSFNEEIIEDNNMFTNDIDEGTITLPNCWDWDRFSHHMRGLE